MPSKLKLSFSKTSLKGDVTTICLIGKNGEIIPHLEKNIAAHLIRTMALAQFTGKFGKSLMVYTDTTSYLLIGTGDKLVTGTEAEKLGGKLFLALNGTASKLGWMPDHKLAPTVLADVLFGANLASYHFDRYFTEKEQDDVMVRLCVGGEALDENLSVYQDRQALANGVFLARDLVFEPANKLFPVEFANRCLALSSLGLEVEVLDETAMKKLGMGALLGVGQGSCRESRMVVMNWRGGGDEPPFAIVGKGVTFDTGGISLKPPKGMEDMKWDMGGAAAVTGAMCAIAGRKLDKNIVGVIGLVENMPDGNAQRPGDVVTAMSGKTIEVINTDAEGRLVLADALHYTETRFKPHAIVNLATLTGAIISSLGKEYGGLFANSDDLASQLEDAGRQTEEGVWRMPMGPAYDRMLKSHIADMKNIGGPYGGAITAACFLARFVERTPWAHLDIAGKAWSDTATATVPKGGTGYGVRLLNRLIDDWQGASVSAKYEQSDD
ncbi:leucyl aminopeptidase [Candidatus Puniceispirillum sp.]|nr:leucyl aminopeptidase [Candidatus Puniceispirillum sp.]